MDIISYNNTSQAYSQLRLVMLKPGGYFVHGATIVNRYQKPPLPVQEQIQKLKERGLKIRDDKLVIHYLSTIGFYRLSAYFVPFEDRNNTSIEHAFLKGTTFDDILRLYIFDRELRAILLEALERIEIAARACWANSLTLDKKSAHAYMDMNNFKTPRKHLQQLNHVANAIERSNEQFVEHYRVTYDEPFLPPTWAMVETLSFGTLSHWYADTMSNDIKKPVSDLLGLPTVELAEGTMHALTLVRNTCAHHSRLWNRQFTKQIPFIKRLKSALVIHEFTDANDVVQRQPDRRLYNYLVVITHIMVKLEPSTHWPQKLIRHIDALKVSEQWTMGFPPNWRDLDFWKRALLIKN